MFPTVNHATLVYGMTALLASPVAGGARKADWAISARSGAVG
jgi:hypothetical protein